LSRSGFISTTLMCFSRRDWISPRSARIIVVMQRIHVDDLAGYLQENEAGFEVLSLPSVAQSANFQDVVTTISCEHSDGGMRHDHEPIRF
jgi:hypothetical protein